MQAVPKRAQPDPKRDATASDVRHVLILHSTTCKHKEVLEPKKPTTKNQTESRIERTT